MHKDLDIWKLEIELVEKIYKITNLFPESEKLRRKHLNFIKYMKSKIA